MMQGFDFQVTSEMLWEAALYFALIDIVFVSLLLNRIKRVDFLKMKSSLPIVMFVFFFLLFGSIVSIIFWDSVYSKVFPSWARWIIPPIYGFLFTAYGLFARWLSLRLPGNSVLFFCMFGGLWGILTHLLAIHRGLLVKVPMLLGAHPISALSIAAVEFIFYWCVCLSITFVVMSLGKHKIKTS